MILRSRRVVTPDGVRAATVHVTGGRITRVAPYGTTPSRGELIDAGDLVVLPGLVDTHVHVNEPGRTHWEGFETATRAAAAGGVTTILDMPLNSIPATTTAAALGEKVQSAAPRAHVDVGFIGGVVPGNLRDLAALRDAGVLAYKAFMVPSGVPEFDYVTSFELTPALKALGGIGAPLMVHAEFPDEIRKGTEAAQGGDPRSHATWLASRPAASEVHAIRVVAELARDAGARLHIVHVASRDAVDAVRHAREGRTQVSAETCPHYLTFDAEQVPDGATEFKCAPPIRESAHREALWDALLDGDLDMIVSDHSPCPPDLKRRDTGDFFAAWGGIASLQLGVSAVWTGMRARKIPLERIAEWMSAAPARLAGLTGRKGAIEAGCDADLVLFDPDAAWTVDPAQLFHRHPVTPYAGMKLAGRVEATYVRGMQVYDRREGHAPEPSGRLLLHRA